MDEYLMNGRVRLDSSFKWHRSGKVRAQNRSEARKEGRAGAGPGQLRAVQSLQDASLRVKEPSYGA